jgi:protease II
MAYTLDLKGDEVYKLYVRNVTWADGKAVKAQTLGPVTNVAGGDIVWANDNTTFFCITQVGRWVSTCKPVASGDFGHSLPAA